MKNKLRIALSVAIACALTPPTALTAGNAYAQSKKARSDVAAFKAEIEGLKRLVPSQSHAMVDVDYHFSSLWFAAQNANWPLAGFYLNETKSHLNWAVRIRPERKLSGGEMLDLRSMLENVENSSLMQLKSAIDKKDPKAFDAAYRQTMTECYACHKAAEKPFLRPRIPEAPASRMIDMKPNAD